jgi:hypothetical protein
MFKMRSANRRPFNLRVLAAICLVFATGCGDSQIKTYRVAKEDSTPKIAPHDHGAEEGAPPRIAEQSSAPLPKVSWTLPKGWKELPSQGGVRKASFGVEGPNGKMAQVAVIPLTVPSNIELESVNMWREELGLNPLSKEEVATQAKPTEVGDAKGNLFEMVSEKSKPGAIDKTRTLGAIAEREGVMWFVKMTGSDDLVAEQRPTFVEFLKSLKFEAPSPTQVAAAERPASTNAKTVPAASNGPKFQIPPNWQQKAPGPMVAAAYTVSGAEGQGEISVSKFPGDVGGLAPNVNRWRGQLGLPELSAAEAQKSVEMVEMDGKKNAYMVDLKGTNARSGKPARMVALGVPRGGETWFYKLIGDEALVAKEKDTFLKFVVSAY